jgi:hypothetical protein
LDARRSGFTMNNAIRLAWSGLLTKGFYITKRTKTEDVLGLIQNLRPQDCGKELIRIGGQKDGGYLIPDDLEGIEYCFQPGVRNIADFENHLADLGIKSFLADYSIDEPPIIRPEFTFNKIFLGSSGHGNFITFASWKDKYIKDYAGDMILQMDIEGGEYEVIINMPDSLLGQFRIMAIEFHYLERLFDPFVFKLFSSSFEKILRQFHVVHLHPNNTGGIAKMGDIEIPRVMEFTFLNKRRVRSTRPQEVFPHKLDVQTEADWKPMQLPECWYRSK